MKPFDFSHSISRVSTSFGFVLPLRPKGTVVPATQSKQPLNYISVLLGDGRLGMYSSLWSIPAGSFVSGIFRLGRIVTQVHRINLLQRIAF